MRTTVKEQKPGDRKAMGRAPTAKDWDELDAKIDELLEASRRTLAEVSKRTDK